MKQIFFLLHFRPIEFLGRCRPPRILVFCILIHGSIVQCTSVKQHPQNTITRFYLFLKLQPHPGVPSSIFDLLCSDLGFVLIARPPPPYPFNIWKIETNTSPLLQCCNITQNQSSHSELPKKWASNSKHPSFQSTHTCIYQDNLNLWPILF